MDSILTTEIFVETVSYSLQTIWHLRVLCYILGTKSSENLSRKRKKKKFKTKTQIEFFCWKKKKIIIIIQRYYLPATLAYNITHFLILFQLEPMPPMHSIHILTSLFQSISNIHQLPCHLNREEVISV